MQGERRKGGKKKHTGKEFTADETIGNDGMKTASYINWIFSLQ